MQILTIAGSLRRDSVNRKLLAQARDLLPAGIEALHSDELASLPAFNEDEETEPAAAVDSLRAAIAAADAVLIATPEYNASISGAMKNALDWASRPFPDNVLRNKAVAVIGASPSPAGAARGQADTRKVLAAIGARVLDVEFALIRAFAQFDNAGRLLDPALRDRLATVLTDLVAHIGDQVRAA